MKSNRFAILLLTLLILLPLFAHAEAGRPLYAVKGDNGKWGYIDYKTGEDGRVRAFFRDDDTLIQPGTGFWYLNGDTTHDSLEW